MSLIPFSTEWIEDTQLASALVAVYALIFVVVNVTYVALCWGAVDQPSHEAASSRLRRLLHMRSVVTIGIFGASAVVATWVPVTAMILICACLVLYLRPDPVRAEGR